MGSTLHPVYGSSGYAEQAAIYCPLHVSPPPLPMIVEPDRGYFSTDADYVGDEGLRNGLLLASREVISYSQ